MKNKLIWVLAGVIVVSSALLANYENIRRYFAGDNENILIKHIDTLKEGSGETDALWLNSINSIQIKDCGYMDIENAENRFIMLKSNHWRNELYAGEKADGELKLTMLSDGLGQVYDATPVSISQGDFIEVYSMTHMGNGDLELYDLDSPYKKRYVFSGIVDRHHESASVPSDAESITVPRESGNPAEEQAVCVPYTIYDYSGLTVGDDGCVCYSKVYEGDRLTASYDDVNGDGNSDVTFRGVEKTIDENLPDKPVIRERYCKYTFLYNADKDLFEYADEYSRYISVE